MSSGVRAVTAVLVGIFLFSTCSNNSKPVNYSAQGACSSLESLINQLGLFEINDTTEFYTQMESVISQANNAAEREPKFATLASQVNSFLNVFKEKYPQAVPNYLGTIPLQVTSDEFCGTDFAGNDA
jgi:hypothetical protein